MFERFTEKAIKVVTFAQEEALKARHSKLYPEHLLLGIIREGSGIAARFLRASGLKAEDLREKINEILVIKQSEADTEILPFSPAVKRILKEAWDEAKSLGANYINPEHLFLSLINEDNITISKLLQEFGVDVGRVKTSVVRVVEKKSKISDHPEDSTKLYSIPEYSVGKSIFKEEGSSQIMSLAREELKNSNYEILGTEQLFLAMLEASDSPLYALLESEGINSHNFREKLSQITSRDIEYDQEECLFTPKAYVAIKSAYELTKELGSATIKPEHILLGILKENRGITCKILKEMGINTNSLFDKVFKPIEKQKPVTLTIIRLAKEEARRLGHNVVGTEQILLGILGEGTGIAAKVLKNLGITLKDTRIEVEKTIGFGNGYLEKEMTFTPRAKKLLEIAWAKAKQFNCPRIESEHLLLGITKEEECMAMKILENLGVDILEIRQGILKAIEEKNLSSNMEQ